VVKLREEIPALFKLAGLVRGKSIVGVHAPKPPNSPPKQEEYIFDFVGMLGLPLVPATSVDPEAKAAFFSQHALADPDFAGKLDTMLQAGKPVLLTSHLADDLKEKLADQPREVRIVKVGSEPRDLYNLTREELDIIRKPLLSPFGIEFSAPSKVALYLYSGDFVVVENFNDNPVDVRFTRSGAGGFSFTSLRPLDRGLKLSIQGKSLQATVPARSLIAFTVSPITGR
jgi:hypothetical protein